jgi:hypothetical protein
MVASLIELTYLERTGFVFKTLLALAVSDRAALGAANILEIEQDEAVMMHDGDKVCAAATGKLERSRQGTVVNLCESGRELMVRANKMAVFFSLGSRLNELSESAKGRLISLSPNSSCSLISTPRASPLSMAPEGLPRYPDSLVIEEGDWDSWAEFEAVLFLT